MPDGHSNTHIVDFARRANKIKANDNRSDKSIFKTTTTSTTTSKHEQRQCRRMGSRPAVTCDRKNRLNHQHTSTRSHVGLRSNRISVSILGTDFQCNAINGESLVCSRTHFFRLVLSLGFDTLCSSICHFVVMIMTKR